MKTEAGLEVVPVIVREWPNKDLIILFPTLPADIYGDTVDSWMRFEGHGAADYGTVVEKTKLAKGPKVGEILDEYHDLYLPATEGFVFDARQRETEAMRRLRRAKAKEQWGHLR